MVSIRTTFIILVFASVWVSLFVFYLQMFCEKVKYQQNNLEATRLESYVTLASLKVAPFSSGSEVAERLTTHSHGIDIICSELQSTNHLSPLEDFGKFPCLPGLPIFPKETWSTTGKCVRTFCYKHETSQSTNRCVSLRTLRGKTPICIYPPKNDVYVSKSLNKTGQWEGGLVTKLANFIRSRPGSEFLDLGCNIGVYTLSLAHLGIKVTAVDPLVENLQLLSQSLSLGNLRDNVTLIWNAVSNDHYQVKFTKGERNVGATQIIEANASSVNNKRDYFARTITLDDLLPLFRGKHVVIKMDIESGEYRALLGGAKFFDEVDVVVIQMEMQFHRKNNGTDILSNLKPTGFYPYTDLAMQRPLDPVRRLPNDVYFFRK